MLVFGVLCLLTPLFASALEDCDPAKTAAVLKKTQLEGNMIDYFENKKFYFVSVSTDGASSTSKSVAVTFGQVDGNTVPINLVYRNTSGDISSNVSSTYTSVGDHILSGTHSLYLFECSPILIAGYRCLNEGESGGYGPVYYVWTNLNNTEDDVVKELDQCYAELNDVDSDATYDRRSRPED